MEYILTYVVKTNTTRIEINGLTIDTIPTHQSPYKETTSIPLTEENFEFSNNMIFRYLRLRLGLTLHQAAYLLNARSHSFIYQIEKFKLPAHQKYIDILEGEI